MDNNVLVEFRADMQDNVSPKLKRIDKGIAGIGNSISRTNPKLNNYPKNIGINAEQVIGKLEKLEKKMKGLNKVATKGIIGVAGATGVALKRFASFESGVLKVKSISNKSLNSISKDIIDLSRKYGISVEKVADANYQLVSSMGDVAGSQKLLATTAELSIAGFTDYESAMNGLVAVMNSYKMGAEEATHVADVLMTVQNKGVTTIDELQKSLSRVTGIASSVGITFEDLSVAMATLTSNKIETSEAVTYLKSAFTELARGGTKANSIFKEIAGTDFSSFLKQGNTLFDAVRLLEEYANSSGQTMLDIFGSAEGANAILNLIGSNTKKVNDTIKAVKESAGTLNNAYSIVGSSTLRTFEQLKAEIDATAITIGANLAPQAKEFLKQMRDINWKEVFSKENIDRIIRTGKQILYVAGTLKALNLVLGVTIKSAKAFSAIKWGALELLTNPKIAPMLLGLGKIIAEIATAMASIAGGVTAGSLAIGGYWAYDQYNSMVTPKSEAVEKLLDGKNKQEQISFLEDEIARQNKEIEKMHQRLKSATGRNLDKKEFELTQMIQMLDALKIKYRDLRTMEQNSSYSNAGYLSAPIGTKMNAEELQKLKDEAKGIVKDTKEEARKIELQTFNTSTNDYNQEVQKMVTYLDKIGASAKEKNQEVLNFAKSKLKDAINGGNKELVRFYEKQYNELKAQANKLSASDISLAYNKGIALAKTKTNKSESIDIELQTIENALEQYKSLEDDKYQLIVEELEQRQKYLKDKKVADEKVIEAQQDHAQAVEGTIQSLASIGYSFSQIGSMTGSKKMSGIGGILGNVASIGGAIKDFGGLGSITGMLGGGSTALYGGMASLGAIAGVATGGIGLALALGSMFGGSGKKARKKIAENNKRNEEIYKKQVSAMEKLTQAIYKNSERIESFSERMLVDMSKRPTLERLKGGKFNFELYHDSMIAGKHFNDISAIEKGSKRYRSGFRHKRKATYTAVNIGEAQILKDLGFDNTEIDGLSAEQMKQLDNVLKNFTHEDLRRVTGRNLTKSNIEEWKKQIHIFTEQIKFLEKEEKEIFEGATLESFSGVNYREEKELIKQYTEQFKELGLVGEHYNEVIKEMAKNNQILVTVMDEVRTQTIEGAINGDKGFIANTKSYFMKIYQNASSVAYDVLFSDIDKYMTNQFEEISNKLVAIKKSGKIDFSDLLTGFDFEQLKTAEVFEKEMNSKLDVLKQELYNSGISLEIINQIFPTGSFEERINGIKQALQNAMTQGLEQHSYLSFTKELGKSLYDSTKNALVKAFSESTLYQGMIKKFINLDDYKIQLESAGSLEEAFKMSEDILKNFGYQLESAGFGGFDAINNIKRDNNLLGNAYYQDKQQSVEVNVTNNFYSQVYGVEDLDNRIIDTTKQGIKAWFDRPRADA